MSLVLMIGDTAHAIEIVRRKPHLVLRVDGREHEVTQPGGAGDGRHEIAVSGRAVRVARAADHEAQIVRLAGRTIAAELRDPRAGADAGGGQDEIRAPMPGAVVSIERRPGDAVTRGMTVMTIESMKLQTALVAPRDGVIAELARAAGETFEKDEVLARLEPATGEA